MIQMWAVTCCHIPAEARGEQKSIGNARQTIPILSFRCTSWGFSCTSLLKGLPCIVVMSLTGNSILSRGHPLCCSCSMVSQRMESGSPALVKFCVFKHQREKIRGAEGELACYKMTQLPNQGVGRGIDGERKDKGSCPSDPSWPLPPCRT